MKFPLINTSLMETSLIYRNGFTYQGSRYEVPRSIGKWQVNYTYMESDLYYGFRGLAYELCGNWGSCSTHVLLRMDFHSLIKEGGLGTWFLDVHFYKETPYNGAYPVGKTINEMGIIRKIDDFCDIMDRLEKGFIHIEFRLNLNSHKSKTRYIS